MNGLGGDAPPADLVGKPSNSDNLTRHSAAATVDIEESMSECGVQYCEELMGDDGQEKSGRKKHHFEKNNRSEERGQGTCRNDINKFNAQFLAKFESSILSDEEEMKGKQLLMLLEKLVRQEWPDARLYLYGSRANSFGFSKCDLDLCLELDLGNVDKRGILLKLVDIFQSNNLHNVKAITHARVPVVKFMDPVTGVLGDISVNNKLALANTKLLIRDYTRIDVRLRQLAFVVKHWAKSLRINDVLQRIFSSYAYVLMCINFLQRCKPPILPCLQGMQITYSVTADGFECTYFDQVEKLNDFGSKNRESIAQLVWAFFHYWAYCHDYANDIISVRTGSTLSKRAKDWTQRVGDDHHLICIEDPIEVSHDLGRLVDENTVRALQQEFERAAEIMQHDHPCVALFEPYVPN